MKQFILYGTLKDTRFTRYKRQDYELKYMVLQDIRHLQPSYILRLTQGTRVSGGYVIFRNGGGRMKERNALGDS
jgi:hypothetical protein